MRRREFMKRAAAATGGVMFASSFPDSSGETPRWEDQIEQDLRDIPALDELSGDWIQGNCIEHTPALSNFHGSLESSRNVLGVQNFTIPPFAQGGEVGTLLLNGVPVAAQEFRWYPYQVQRRAAIEDISVSSTVRMPFEQSGFLFRIEITNRGAAVYAATLAISLRAGIRQYPGKWQWDTPRPKEQYQADFQYREMHANGVDLLYSKDVRSQSLAGFLFVSNPAQTTSLSTAAWNLTIKPGETFSLQGVMAVGPDIESVARQAAAWKANFPDEWDEAKAGWERRYRAAFDPGNKHFSGNLPVLVTSDTAIRRLYYHSILSLLCLERTNLNPRYPRVFVTASPRWATTLVYFWDTSFFATLWAMLDPVSMKEQVKLFLASNIHSCYAIDFQSMETVGPWYSANDYSIFQLVNIYVDTTGEHQFLDETVAGNKRVIDYLEEICLHWKALTKPPGLLADYGDASNLLETVPTYIHRVPSMNAANVWMMRSMAAIRTTRGEATRAEELNQLADKLAKEILELYIDGQGFWACEMPDGKRVEVRHCIDFFTTIGAMKNELGSKRIEEMISFVSRELWTPDWLYALSPKDGASKLSLRPDHGSTGSYDAWPALTAEAFFRAGKRVEALDHLRSVVSASREGPFGQAHYVATNACPVRKALDLQDYFESASGAFAEIIVRTLFGVAGLGEMRRTAAAPGFQGSLRNLRYRGKFLTITVPAQ